MKVVLISTYELGHQPFGLASPAAWLRREGCEVTCIDSSQRALDGYTQEIRSADLIAFHLPMHTATRIATPMMKRVRQLNLRARLCAYGLYSPMNAELLWQLGVWSIIGGEFEAKLVEMVRDLRAARATLFEPQISLERQQFLVPDRSGLVPLGKYSKLVMPGGEERVTGYTEASRGCKHLCRHCPIVPVYNGTFRVVQRDVVIADIRQQVEAGAKHITFGDPDFFNGPTHAMQLVEQLHGEFPDVSYDVTIKVEHLLKHANLLPKLRDSGCAFVISAIESLDNRVLQILDKGHTRDDFFRVVQLMREVGLNLSPTFVAFHPWTTLETYREFLQSIADLGLIENVQPIQLAIRLLIPAGSKLLELAEVREMVSTFDKEALAYPWKHADPRVDELQREIEKLVQKAAKFGWTRRHVFAEAVKFTDEKLGLKPEQVPATQDVLIARAAIPYLTEPWYC